MTVLWIGLVALVLTFVLSEGLRPRPRTPGPGERVKTGLFTWEVAPLGDFRCPRCAREWAQFEETGEVYRGQDLDEANPFRGPRADR